jgi:hypothetical protein
MLSDGMFGVLPSTLGKRSKRRGKQKEIQKAFLLPSELVSSVREPKGIRKLYMLAYMSPILLRKIDDMSRPELTPAHQPPTLCESHLET